jgi:hypothetical protein
MHGKCYGVLERSGKASGRNCVCVYVWVCVSIHMGLSGGSCMEAQMEGELVEGKKKKAKE